MSDDVCDQGGEWNVLEALTTWIDTLTSGGGDGVDDERDGKLVVCLFATLVAWLCDCPEAIQQVR